MFEIELIDLWRNEYNIYI